MDSFSSFSFTSSFLVRWFTKSPEKRKNTNAVLMGVSVYTKTQYRHFHDQSRQGEKPFKLIAEIFDGGSGQGHG